MFALALTVALAQDAPVEPAPVAEAAVAKTYTLDAGKSFLGVLVKYDRSAFMKGHDHVVSPSSFKGSVTWGPDLAACNVAISFPVTALQVDPAGSRERLKLEGTTSDGNKASIKENLEGKHQLEASKFPEISFQSTKCEQKGDSVAVSGTLELHGVGAPVTAMMKVDSSADVFKARGSFQATHSTWSFDPFTALLGSLKNDPALAFTIDVVGTP